MTSPLDTQHPQADLRDDPDAEPGRSDDSHRHHGTTPIFTTLGPNALVMVYDPSQNGNGYISPANFVNAQTALTAAAIMPVANPLVGSDALFVYPSGGGAAQITTVAQLANFATTASVSLVSPTGVVANTAYTVSGLLSGYSRAPTLSVLIDGASVTPSSGSPTATAFTFTMPGLPSGSHTVCVKDASGVASLTMPFTVALPVPTATASVPTGSVTVGQPVTFTGTVANATSLYVCLSNGGHDEQARVPANVSGSNWTATLTPTATGTTAICVYAAATGGSALVLSRSFTVAASATGYADGFNAPGIYGPTTLYQNSGNGSGYTIGTYFVRGLHGPVTWSSSGFDGSVRAMTSNQLNCVGAAYVNPVLPTQTGTVSATDGTTTFTLQVTIIENANCPDIPQGFVLDTMQNTIGSWINSVGNAVSPSFSSADGAVTYNAGGGGMYTAETVTGHYGLHQGTFVNNGVAFPVAYWFITELPPVAKLVLASQTYSTTPVGAAVGQLNTYSDAGICNLAITSPGGVLSISASGQINTVFPLAAGTLSASITVTSPSGLVATVPLSLTVQQGNTIPSANMTASLSTTLDNSMGSNGTPGPVTVGTVSVTGVTNPTWSIAVQNDECQFLTVYNSTALNPRYAITANAGNPNQATITANYLSAQTDQLQVSATWGGNVCTNTFPLTVAANGGPTVTITPGASPTATVFPTWNSALDAMWTTPATYQGMTVTLPGGTYTQTANDFSRTQIGHGSNQQWPCGPYTLTGPSAANRTILDFAFSGRGTGQGALYSQGGDCTFQNLVIQRVSNISYGEGNCGGIYKTNQQPYNLTIRDCCIWDCDMGPMNGDYGNHLLIERCVLAHNGIGAGGLTHNIYAGHYSSVTATNVLSFSTAQVHEFKTRAGRGTFTNCLLLDGENGNPGASACLDICDAGQYVVTGGVMQKGPNPNNDGSIVQFGAEVYGNPPGWAVNTLLLDGVTFINTAAPGSFTSQVYALVVFDHPGGGPLLSPVTGIPVSAIVRNCKFYNIPKSHWWQAQDPGNPITDGGGNTNIFTWPQDLLPIDPSTGQTLTILPPPSYAITNMQGGGLMVPSGVLQIRFPVGTAVGTNVVVITGYDNSGAPLKNPAYSILGEITAGQSAYTPSTNFAINPATGQITVANASIPDGLRWIQVKGTGTDYTGRSQTYEKYLFIVVGQGTIPSN